MKRTLILTLLVLTAGCNVLDDMALSRLPYEPHRVNCADSTWRADMGRKVPNDSLFESCAYFRYKTGSH